MKRIIVILMVTAIGIIASFVDAFYGILLYAFYTFVSPLELVWWTALYGARLSFMVAGFVIVTALLQKKRIILNHKTTYLCCFLLFYCFASLAVRQDILSFSTYGWERMWVFTRLIIMLLVTSALISNLQKLRIYILAVAVFIGLLGAYYGIFGLFAGSTSIAGPGGGRFGDNNGYAVFLNTALPFIYYAGVNLKRKSWRYLSKIIFLGNIIAIILTFSRGGFITLLVILALIFLNIKRKIIYFILIPVALLILFFITPTYIDYVPTGEERAQSVEKGSVVDRTLELYKKRIGSIKTFKEDVSVSGRFYFWKLAIKMANENPLFGVGFMRYKEVYNEYDETDGLYGRERVVHNTYLEFLADIGYPGLLLFILVLLSTLVNINNFTRQIKIKNLPEREEFLSYSTMLQISIVTFCLGSTFVNMGFLDLFWAIVAISMAMDNISKVMINESTIQLS